MNARTCQTVEDPSTYSLVELNCLYEGKGRYMFEGPSSLRRVTIARFTEESNIIILRDLYELVVLTGKSGLCRVISSPKSTIVKIGSAYCPEMFSKILSTSSNDGYGSIRIMKMVTAPDVDISATSTADTSTSEMSTSYSTKWETKGTDYYRRCTLDRFNRGKHCRVNNAPPAFPFQNLILTPPPQRAQPPPPQRAQLQPPQAVQLPTPRRSGRRTTNPKPT
ncbi:Hypothetical predicted protein [Mytilus galloprovincialis]|uniref:Uncharacterized protein n=1 Tax=Mytilus galloprovincialis TaxID=29158 RepID=A0A8B6CR85_MYTGA|nr:Hypothetical predicted protein [Mytilus galloprovincialis]